MTSATPGGRILIVDDEPTLREVAREFLAGMGYVVSACANGREALEALQRNTFDAVLSDVRMPDMDGLGLLRAVRAQDLDVPVLLWTGSPSVETAAEAVEHGALQYLVKPVPTEKLLEATSRAVKLGALARLKRQALLATGFDQLVGDRAGLEAAFARAIWGVFIAYQPIVRAGDGSLYAHEALLRTTEPVFPNPGALLSAAERLGRLSELGRAIRASIATLFSEGRADGLVFVNLHPADLADEGIFDRSEPLSRFAPRVVLEITERARLDGVPDVSDRVRELRGDMALVRDLDRDTVKQKLVGSIAALCRDLGIHVVAEGIETPGEREASERAGCELLQGFLLGRPTRIPPE
jgi:EAL domain-containing protein (putative c-di-GMP-specific phosphodiesterase class I)